jgi:hypothetical protein
MACKDHGSKPEFRLTVAKQPTLATAAGGKGRACAQLVTALETNLRFPLEGTRVFVFDVNLQGSTALD